MEHDPTWRSDLTENWAIEKGSSQLESGHISKSDIGDLFVDEVEKLGQQFPIDQIRFSN